MSHPSLVNSNQQHRRERFRHIILPMIITVAVTVAVVLVLAVVFSAPQLGVVANCMSALILPMAVLTCVMVQALMVLLVWGTSFVYNKTDLWVGHARNLALQARILTLKASTWVAKPVIWFNQAFTSIETGLQALRGKREIPATPLTNQSSKLTKAEQDEQQAH